jgi:SecD/SecF fusion protein
LWALIEQNGSGKIVGFTGPNKEVKPGDDDKTVTSKLKQIGKGAISQTYKILQKCIDKFGVAQPNINLDENKGVINVELCRCFQANPERVPRVPLQSSANLQFWSVVPLRDQDFQKSFTDADKALAKYFKRNKTILQKISDSKS